MALVSDGVRVWDPMGVRWPCRRIMGGMPVVMWRSDAPLSIISFSRSWRFGIPRRLLGSRPPLVTRGHPHQLLQAGHAFSELLHPRLAQGLHAVLAAEFPELDDRGPLQDALLDVFPDHQDLVQGHAALVSGLAAGDAALALDRDDGLGILGVETEVDQHLEGNRRGLFALRA